MAKHVIHPFTGEAHQIGPDSLVPPSPAQEASHREQAPSDTTKEEEELDRLFSGGPWNYMSIEGCGPYGRD